MLASGSGYESTMTRTLVLFMLPCMVTPALSQDVLGRVNGTWRQDATGDTIHIRRFMVSASELLHPRLGRIVVTAESAYDTTIKVTISGKGCSYSVVREGETMRWESHAINVAPCSILAGVLRRAPDSPPPP